MAYDTVVADPGSGGEQFAFDQFLDSDSALKTMAHGAISWGPLDGPYHPVDKSTPFPVRDHISSGRVVHATDSPIAAGGQATLNSTQITSGKTGHLVGLLVWSSAPLKVTIQTVANGTPTTRAVGGSPAGIPFDWKSPNREFITVDYDVSAGLDSFRVVLDNLDPAIAVTVYATFFYDEVDT